MTFDGKTVEQVDQQLKSWRGPLEARRIIFMIFSVKPGHFECRNLKYSSVGVAQCQIPEFKLNCR